jgi:TRAP-type transport system small permease protein
VIRRVLDGLCGTLAALALFAIMALTLVDVAGRKLLSSSLPGSLELTEILMVVVIFASLPLVSLHGEHVAFDSLDRWLHPRVRRLQHTVMEALCAAAMVGIAWLMWVKAGQMLSYGDVTAQLKLPVGAFVYVMSVLCGLAGAVHAALVLVPTLGQSADGADITTGSTT